jgi:hypothetical protein
MLLAFLVYVVSNLAYNGSFFFVIGALTSMMQGQIEKETRHNGIIWRAVNGY